jgi:hypothetical protein
MHCPPEIAAILTEILATGLLRIRALGWGGNAARCAVEADHLHNLPALLSSFRQEWLDYYWHAERPAFIQSSAHEDVSRFEPLWGALAAYVSPKSQTVATR